MKARVHITLKNGVLDPQGRAIAHALTGLGFTGVGDVRQGKYIELDLIVPEYVILSLPGAFPMPLSRRFEEVRREGRRRGRGR